MMDPVTRSIDTLGSEVCGVLARSVPSRVIEISRSGCLLESRHHVDHGTVGELQMQVHGELLVDDVRVTRCVLIEGSGSSYLVGAEFLQTRRPGERSIRRAVTGILRGLTQPEKVTHSRKLPDNGRKAERGAAAPDTVSLSTGEAVMKDLLARFVRKDEGQDLIEYGLLAGIITAATASAIGFIGPKVQGYLEYLNGVLPAPKAAP